MGGRGPEEPRSLLRGCTPSLPASPLCACRHASLSLACRRFWRLVHSPPLLRAVDIDVHNERGEVFIGSDALLMER